MVPPGVGGRSEGDCMWWGGGLLTVTGMLQLWFVVVVTWHQFGIQLPKSTQLYSYKSSIRLENQGMATKGDEELGPLTQATRERCNPRDPREHVGPRLEWLCQGSGRGARSLPASTAALLFLP